MKDVYLRIKEFLDELKKKYKDERILLVTHGGISRAIYWAFNCILKNGNSSDVNLENETVWLFLEQMSNLFGRVKPVISRHIKHVFEEGELDKNLTTKIFSVV